MILATSLSFILLCACSSGKDYYRAATFEVAPFYGTPIRKIAEQNLGQYGQAAKQASANGADIIVFPEDGIFVNADQQNRTILIGNLAENVPDPKQRIYNPCDQDEFSDQYVLRTLSCMAKDNGIYVVANMLDYKMCGTEIMSTDPATYNCQPDKDCPKDGFYLFNTNVVFNRKGELVARYHKKHLYHEPTNDASKCPDNGYFETDFGPFLTFICFDMLFTESINTLKVTNIKNLAFSNYWYDRTPFFLFALIYQKAYAYENGINIIASNSNVPGTGTVGSGIFSGTAGTIVYSYEPDFVSKLMISNVPRQPTDKLKFNELDRKKFVLKGNDFKEVDLESKFDFEDECEIKVRGGPKSIQDFREKYRCNSVDIDKYEFKKLEKKEDDLRICHGSFCCSLRYKAKSMDEDYYLGISKGGQTMMDLTGYKSKACFLARCKSKSNKCHNFVLKSKTVFERVSLKGNFKEEYIYPSALDSNVRLTDDSQWSFDESRRTINYKKLNKDTSLLFLSLYATNYK